MWPNVCRVTRRSIKKIWHKEWFYLRSNPPFYIFASIIIFSSFYNAWWSDLPEQSAHAGVSPWDVKVFDNFRFSKHKFVRVLICIPENVVDYRFSTVSDAIRLTHLDYPDLQFIKDIKKGKQVLDEGKIDILILFTTLIESGKTIDYNIISRSGDLNKHYCTTCDTHRQLAWGHAIEAQVVVNRFLYWLIKARGFSTREPHMQLTNVYLEQAEIDNMFAKRQTDLFVAWLMLLPICYRLLISWADDRKSGFYEVLLALDVKRHVYFIAKFQIWLFFALAVSFVVWIANVLVVRDSFTSTFPPFLVVYVACIIAFTIFLASIFPDSPHFAGFVGILMMAAGEFGFGKVGHGVLFFQLSVRFFGKSTEDAKFDDQIAILCMLVNFIAMAVLSLYFDTFFYSFSPEKLTLWFPLERGYWRPKKRDAQVDDTHCQQILPLPKENTPLSKGKRKEEQPKDDEKKQDEVKDEMIGKPIVMLYGVCKRVNSIWCVNKFSASFRYGEITTLYGYKGCGSDEVLSIISGKMAPEYGERILDKSVRPLVVSQTTEVPHVNYLNVEQYLRLVSAFRGIILDPEFLEKTLVGLDLRKVRKISLDLLSTTQKGRLRIAAAFVGLPDVVLIHSPTRDAPPRWKYMILNYIQEQKGKRAVVISSYDEEETEAVSDRIILMSEGYVILNGLAETYRQSMSSVFEFRVWPMSAFSDEQIHHIHSVIGLDDINMKADVKYFETPNGKLRFLIPTVYRRCINLIFEDLEKILTTHEIAYFEISKPTIQDVYTNACFQDNQYSPLQNYSNLRQFYKDKKEVSRSKSFFKNLARILKDRWFLIQVAMVSAAFVLLAMFTVFSWQKTHTHFTHKISLENNDYPVKIYCDGCYRESDGTVTYMTVLGEQEIKKNSALLFWKENTTLADVELFSISRGDDTFTLIIQNFAISQMIYRMTNIYPNINPTLESDDFRESKASEGISILFRDVNTNQAAMILSQSHSLLYLLGVFQTCIYTLSALLPLRLVSVHMRPTSMLFPWPRYLYFSLITAANMVCFLVLAIVFTVILLCIGMFETSRVGSSIHFLLAWFLAYGSTLPLIYWLVFNVSNAFAVIPTVMAVSSLFVNLPNMISSFSAENAISLGSLLSLVSWTSVICPSTALQVFAAFLNAGEFHQDNKETIWAFTILLIVHFVITTSITILCIWQPFFPTIAHWWVVGYDWWFSSWFNRASDQPMTAENRHRIGAEGHGHGKKKMEERVSVAISPGYQTPFPPMPKKKAVIKSPDQLTNDKVSTNTQSSVVSNQPRPNAGKDKKSGEKGKKGSKIDKKNNKKSKEKIEKSGEKAKKGAVNKKSKSTEKTKSKENDKSGEKKSIEKDNSGDKNPKNKPVAEPIYENAGPSKESPENADLDDKKLSTESIENPKLQYLAGEKMKDTPKEQERLLFKNGLSYIGRMEEDMIVQVNEMQRWDDKQEVAVENSALYLLGDQTRLKTSVLKAIVELNGKNEMAYVPYVECLPTVFTPVELLENVAACHGVQITPEHINYLLSAFGLEDEKTKPIANMTDADRRILMLLAKLVVKPKTIVLDQLDMFLPYSKMMTVWSLCSRLREDNVSLIYSTQHSSFAEHTATVCGHLDKCQFMRTIPPSSMKATIGCTILEVVPVPTVCILTLKSVLNEAFKKDDLKYLPSMKQRLAIYIPFDDLQSLNRIMSTIKTLSDYIIRYSLRSASFEEYAALSFEKMEPEKELI